MTFSSWKRNWNNLWSLTNITRSVPRTTWFFKGNCDSLTHQLSAIIFQKIMLSIGMRLLGKSKRYTRRDLRRKLWLNNINKTRSQRKTKSRVNPSQSTINQPKPKKSTESSNFTQTTRVCSTVMERKIWWRMKEDWRRRTVRGKRKRVSKRCLRRQGWTSIKFNYIRKLIKLMVLM